MLVQSQIAQTVQADTGKIADLVNASQGAVGSLQAQQAANQLLALSIKQQLQAQTLMVAQGRAEALKDANEAEAELEGQAAFQTFLGSSNAYSPQ
jgi:P-type conjugative transfer protein TrbJ